LHSEVGVDGGGYLPATREGIVVMVSRQGRVFSPFKGYEMRGGRGMHEYASGGELSRGHVSHRKRILPASEETLLRTEVRARY
jgi:hypothetical protein